jgi:hypothetical protein
VERESALDPGQSIQYGAVRCHSRGHDQLTAVTKLCMFEQFVRELQCVRLSGMLQALLLNVYNAMAEHAFVRYRCPVDWSDVGIWTSRWTRCPT